MPTSDLADPTNPPRARTSHASQEGDGGQKQQKLRMLCRRARSRAVVVLQCLDQSPCSLRCLTLAGSSCWCSRCFSFAFAVGCDFCHSTEVRETNPPHERATSKQVAYIQGYGVSKFSNKLGAPSFIFLSTIYCLAYASVKRLRKCM